MKDYNEIAENVISRRDEYDKAQKRKRKKIIQISSAVGCFVVVAVVSVGIWQSGLIGKNPSPSESHTYRQDGGNKTTSTTEQTQPTTTQKNETPTDDGDKSAGGDGGNYWMIPVIPAEREFTVTGEAITDAEAHRYFSDNKESLTGSLVSSGVSAESVKISDKGYCHVNYNGEKGKGFEVRQNSRDYLVYSGNELVAIFTLYKENGEITCTPSFGAKWFDSYNNYLKKHKGEKLVYVYASWFEIIIAPDNTYFNPMGLDVSTFLEGVEKPYEVFFNEAATYTP